MATDKHERKGSLIRLGLGYLFFIIFVVMLGCLLYRLGGEYLGWPAVDLQQLGTWGLGAWLALVLFCPSILLAWEQLAVRQAQRSTLGGDGSVAASRLNPLPDLKDDEEKLA
ncbi:hypothetical protein, partial [Pseudomonas brassicacearum]|uniref:hypothetical protein n=1 Tax=Pseudomonas brassicacearum TaxID=930166 RepID=UPI001C639575